MLLKIVTFVYIFLVFISNFIFFRFNIDISGTQLKFIKEYVCMIKPVMGNSLVKKTVLGTMMARAVMAGGAVTKNNNSNANIQRTEISKEAAEASKTSQNQIE